MPRFFFIYFVITGEKKSFVVPRTLLYRALLCQGSTVLKFGILD